MTSPEGPLASGIMPKVGGMTESGEKALMESLNRGSDVKKIPKTRKRKEKEDEEDTGEVEVKTKQQEVADQKDDILKQATDARKYALSLKHLNYSGELVSGLMGFSDRMEKIYEHINKLMEKKIDAESSKWVDILKSVQDEVKWYTNAEAYTWGSWNNTFVHL